jgi:hypothetical protein
MRETTTAEHDPRNDDRRAHNTRLWQSPDHEISFLCECDGPACTETVPLTASAYRLIVEAGGRPVSAACLERERRSAAVDVRPERR